MPLPSRDHQARIRADTRRMLLDPPQLTRVAKTLDAGHVQPRQPEVSTAGGTTTPADPARSARQLRNGEAELSETGELPPPEVAAHLRSHSEPLI